MTDMAIVTDRGAGLHVLSLALQLLPETGIVIAAAAVVVVGGGGV